MNKFERVTKPLMWPTTLLMTAILSACGSGSSNPATPSSNAQALATAVSAQATSGAKSTAYSVVSTTPNITVTGTHAGNVAPVLTGGGSINVVNNGAFVAATQTGTGTISITNNGQVMAATNTGTGTMTINSTNTGAVAVTNTGNGNITVNATGTTPISLTYNDGLDHTYPVAGPTVAGLGFSVGQSTNPNIVVSGSAASNVTSVITGGGSINAVNTGAHVAATQTGLGVININNSVGVLAATNTGTGTMTITNTDTGAVAITRTGNGNTTVTASGTTPLALTFNGDGDVTYPSIANGLASSLGVSSNASITVSGSAAHNVAPVLTGGGTIDVVNNGAHVAATQTGTGAINIVNNGGVLAATNSGTGVMTIGSNATAAVTVTMTGNGNVTVNATGSTPIALVYTDNLDHVYPVAGVAIAGLGSGVNPNIIVSGSNAGAVIPTITGGGFINVTNNGAGVVTATETGTGTVTVVNNKGSAGLTATNTGNGLMTITSTATAAVTVTNTGNGNVTVTATGSNPITLTHNGDDDFTYPQAGATSSILSVSAVAPLSLGLAGAFEILTGTGITDTGGSSITGNIGSSGITAAAMNNVTCPEVNVGAAMSIYGDDATYAPLIGGIACYATGDVTTTHAAVVDMITAYNDAANGTQHPANSTELGAGNIGGMTFAPGTYKWSSVVTIPTNVTLNGGPNDVWLFQVAQGVSLAPNMQVVLTGGAVPANVFWQVGGVMSIGTNSTMNGVVLSKTGITLGANAIVHGKLLAQSNVTLISNKVGP